MPAVALEVLELCQREGVALSELAEVIGRDPALTARLLQVTNSPLFNLRREVTRLTEAIVWLGLQSTRTLALGFSLVGVLKGDRGGGFDHEACWRRSILSAVGARALATALRLASWEEAFLAGLLQDIGMMALHQALGAEYDAVVSQRPDHASAIEAEREAFGGDHAEASAWLAEAWGLPDLYQKALAHSHDPDCSGLEAEGEVGDVVRCVALGGWLADIWLCEDKALATRRASERAEDIFGMDRVSLSPVLEAMGEQIPTFSALFEVALVESDDILFTLDQARELLVRFNIQAAFKVVSLEAHTKKLEERAGRDELTGLSRRGRLDAFLGEAFAHARRADRALSVLFCDIDHFKSINDDHGHQAGDKVLEGVARLLSGAVRGGDMVGRYGGEEFVVVLPGLDSQAAVSVAERIRVRVEATPHWLPSGAPLYITISVGVATSSPEQCFLTGEQLVGAADAALYKAKRAGRNRVERHAHDRDLSGSQAGLSRPV